jgi:predicted nucleotidyltransferase
MFKKSIKLKIKEYFFVNPNSKHRVRELERILKLPLPSVIKYCKDLEKEKILQIISIGNVNFYTANQNNENYILEKKLFNLKQIFDSGLIDYLKIELSNPPIILFGSYSKGEDIENSDIDIYIQTISKKEIKFEKFEKYLKRNIQIIKFKSLKEISNKNLANNIINGIILNNYIEVF